MDKKNEESIPQAISLSGASLQVQALIDKYNELKELSPSREKTELTDKDKEILSQMSDIYKKLYELDAAKNISGFVSANISDYDITIEINGKNIGIDDELLGKNDEGDAVSLLKNADSIMKTISMSPDQVFVLKEGINTIRVTYKNKKQETSLRVKLLSYDLSMYEENLPVISIKSDKTEGIIEEEFYLYEEKGSNFQPVFIEE